MPRWAEPGAWCALHRRLLVVLAVTTLAGCGAGGSATAGSTGQVARATSHPATTATTTTSSTTSATTTSRATSTPSTRSATAASRAPTLTRRPVPAATTSTARLAPVPRQPAQPALAYPVNDPAYGKGANAVVTAVGDALWARMAGYSWTSQCPVGRSGLRVVQVNFWGFDGLRSRGSVVVASAIAGAVAGTFTDLYDQGFRIRQMRPMDSRWGHNPKGPGADDYAAMQADNTSAFNCRYVGGEEASKKWSRHALGLAVDVNDFENPYVDVHGVVYPDAYYLSHRRGAGVLAGSSSATVRAFTSRGLSWEGTSSPPDYQHFDG